MCQEDQVVATRKEIQNLEIPQPGNNRIRKPHGVTQGAW